MCKERKLIIKLALYKHFRCQQCIEVNASSRTQCMTKYKRKYKITCTMQRPLQLAMTSKVCQKKKCPCEDINSGERNGKGEAV